MESGSSICSDANPISSLPSLMLSANWYLSIAWVLRRHGAGLASKGDSDVLQLFQVMIRVDHLKPPQIVHMIKRIFITSH